MLDFSFVSSVSAGVNILRGYGTITNKTGENVKCIHIRYYGILQYIKYSKNISNTYLITIL
jgi:hypothetical protein